MKISDSALLEWVDSLEVAKGHHVQSLEGLRDGELLLRAMHDILPDIFPVAGPAAASHLRPLLAGLREHFRRRPGRGEACAQQLAEQEAFRADVLDISLLVQLVIWATLDNDGSRRQEYMDLCERLSNFSKEAIMDIAEHFGEAAGSPQVAFATPVSARPSLGGELALSPAGAAAEGLPDFMEVGLDDETRYRRLKKCYHAVMEEQERLEDERNLLRRQLEAEIKKRQDAEEGERMARMELKESDEARHRMREESRALFEVRLEQEAQKFREQLKHREKQIEALQEERDLARAQAGKADKLSEQLGVCRKKLEGSQAWKRERDELRRQLDEVVSSKNSDSGGNEHLRVMLDRTRREANVLLEERDEAQRQVLQLQQEMGQLREDGASRGAPGAQAVSTDTGHRPSTPSARSPKGTGVEELKSLLHSQKDELLERLLAEKERATRAETTLQLKQAEVDKLADQRTRDQEALRALEERARAQAGRLSELESQGPPPRDRRGREEEEEGGERSGRLRELQALLAQRERELQIHRWRGQTESDTLAAQETLMASCLHELGLRYHKLLLQNGALLRRLHAAGAPGGGGGAAAPADPGSPSPARGGEPPPAGG